MKRAWPYAAVLAAVNAYICRGLFSAEYTGHFNSIQGLWIAMARLAGEQWWRPSWWPYQDAGMAFEYLYMPLTPAATALLAWIGHVSAARAFHFLMALVYCFGPVTLFAMAWRISGAVGYSFWAALAYSVTSPARALIRDPYFDPSFFWTSRRLYTMVVWDDLPHGLSLCFVAIAAACLWRARDSRRLEWHAAAVASIALAALASVFGIVAMAMVSLCLMAARPMAEWRANVRALAGVAAASYSLVLGFLPPSLIATIRANQQQYVEDRWSAQSLVSVAIVGAGFVFGTWLLARLQAERPLRFFVLLAWLASSIPLADTYLNSHFLPQAGRYQPEMEVSLALAGTFAVRRALARVPFGLKPVLAALVVVLAARQMVLHARYAAEITRGVDVRPRIEYRVAEWMSRNLQGRRVMVPGSMAQWLNVFSDVHQLSGGSYSTTPNPAQQQAMVAVLGPAPVAEAIRWLQDFGVSAVTVCGPKSGEFWKPFANPRKFDGVLPVLWSEDDVTIYAVPAARVAEVRWFDVRHAQVRATEGTTVVPVNYHPGWRAYIAGRAVPLRRDALGRIAVDAGCSGCEVELVYQGGWEAWFCRAISALALLLGLLCLGHLRKPIKVAVAGQQ